MAVERASVGARLRTGGLTLRIVRSPEVGDSLEVLLVSRRKCPDSFTLPAGRYEESLDGGSFERSALRHLREEAGVKCNCLFDLGWYDSTSKEGLTVRTRIFAMQYLSNSSRWQEAPERSRRWMPLSEARGVLEHYSSVQQAVDQLQQILQERRNQGLDLLTPDPSLRAGAESPVSSDESDGMDEAVPPVWLQSEDSRFERTRSMSDCDGETDDLPQRFDSRLSIRSSRGELAEMIDSNGEAFHFYGNQVGGHNCLVKPAPETAHITVRPPGAASMTLKRISAKHVLLKPTDERELRFYLDVGELAPALESHLPTFYGTRRLSKMQVEAMVNEVDSIIENGGAAGSLESRMRSHEFQKYIVMEDLAESMTQPWILDLKMGYRQRSKTYNEKKRAKARQKAVISTTSTLGFRVCGFHTHISSFDKYWGRRANAEAVLEKLTDFFMQSPTGSLEQRRARIHEVLGLVRRIRETVSSLPGWRFWSTSLLMLYDAGDPAGLPTIRMIDFAHCTRVRAETPDVEYMGGLMNFEIFLSAVAESQSFPWLLGRIQAPPPVEVTDAEEMEDAIESDIPDLPFEEQ